MLHKIHSLGAFRLIIFLSSISFSQHESWRPKGLAGEGSLFCLSFNLNSTNEIFMGCDLRELFRSTNLGSAWQPVHFSEMQGGSNSKVQFVLSIANLLYCINHKGDVSTASKSTDGGNTWSDLAGDPTGGEA